MLIVLNVVVMSTDWVDPDGTTPQTLTDIVGAINDVFAIIFVLEVIIKNIAMTPCLYFRDSWCLFDFAISVTSGIDTLFTVRERARLSCPELWRSAAASRARAQHGSTHACTPASSGRTLAWPLTTLWPRPSAGASSPLDRIPS